MTGIPFFLCFPAWQTLRSWAFGAVTWNFNMKPHRKRLMLSLNPNGITKNSPTIESIGRKAENWIKSIVVVLYCVDKTARYLLQSQKNSIVCCCTAFKMRCESKDAFLRGAPLGWEPFVFTLQQVENYGYQNCRRTGGKRLEGYST